MHSCTQGISLATRLIIASKKMLDSRALKWQRVCSATAARNDRHVMS
jgi:hypothetical protein